MSGLTPTAITEDRSGRDLTPSPLSLYLTSGMVEASHPGAHLRVVRFVLTDAGRAALSAQQPQSPKE
jgi:hypothetical protein